MKYSYYLTKECTVLRLLFIKDHTGHFVSFFSPILLNIAYSSSSCGFMHFSLQEEFANTFRWKLA